MNSTTKTTVKTINHRGSIFTKLLLGVFVFLCTLGANAQFTAGNLVVLQVGDGTAALNSNATPVFLKEFTTAGAAGTSVTIPTSGASALTINGTATSEGFITRSSDGLSILIPGYNALSGTVAITTTSSSTFPRAIGKVNISGAFSLPATTTSFSGGNPRGATGDGTNYWGSGSSTGIVLESSGAGTIVSSTVTNTRAINIFNGNLYFSTGSGTQGIYQVGTGLPTGAGNTSTVLIPTGTLGGGTSPYGFSFNANGTVCYVADDGVGIKKYLFNGSVWTLAYTVTNNACRGLVVDYSSADPNTGVGAIVYITHATLSLLLKMVDNGAPLAVTTTLATGPVNTFYRGIAFAPAVSCTPPLAPLITATNSTCQPGCTVGGGSFNIVTPCTTGTLTYYSDGSGSSPTTTPPTYNQTTAMTIYYACEISSSCRSTIQSLTTVPGSCTNPATPGTPTSNSPQCVNVGVTLTANGSAPGGETWYWQGTNSTGTSTANNATSTYNAPSSGTYYIRSQNNTTQCWSAAAGVTVSVNALPTITLGANPSVCAGVISANLPYSGTTNNGPVQNNNGLNPNAVISILQYKIDFDVAAHTAGFADVVYTNLSGSPIAITVPGAAPAATYNGTLKVKYPSTGCESIGYPITVTVNPLPSSPVITVTNSTCQPGCTVGGGSFNITPCVGSTMTFYSDNAGSNPTTTPPVYNQTTPMTIYYACVDGTTGCRSAIQSLTTVPGTCPAPGTWLGITSTDWFTTSNWSCGVVPIATTDVTIPSPTPNPCVIPAGSAQAHNLTINSSATLTISNGAALTINGGGLVTNYGTFINNGTFNQ